MALKQNELASRNTAPTRWGAKVTVVVYCGDFMIIVYQVNERRQLGWLGHVLRRDEDIRSLHALTRDG